MASSSVTETLNLNARYPSPPRVQWWAFFAILLLINVSLSLALTRPLLRLVIGMVANTWAIYLCLWIRQLDPKALSIYWTLGSFLGDSAAVILLLLAPGVPEQTALVAASIFLFSLASIGAAIAGTFFVRHELLKHYNHVEPIGLTLSPLMTFFFSYIYFQYHLCKIAKAKSIANEAAFTN